MWYSPDSEVELGAPVTLADGLVAATDTEGRVWSLHAAVLEPEDLANPDQYAWRPFDILRILVRRLALNGTVPPAWDEQMMANFAGITAVRELLADVRPHPVQIGDTYLSGSAVTLQGYTYACVIVGNSWVAALHPSSMFPTRVTEGLPGAPQRAYSLPFTS